MLNKLQNNIKQQLFNILDELGYVNESSIKDYNDIVLETPRDSSFGDLSTNCAMRLAKVAHKAPIMIAEEIVNKVNPKDLNLSKISFVAPGFINMTIDPTYLSNIIFTVNKEGSSFGNGIKNNKHICIEYVSANPTGILHVGHGRGGAYGDTLSNVMTKAGYNVNREFYINDAGNQITNMALSVYARYKELFGLPLDLPEDGYHGKEIIDVAKLFKDEYGDKYLNNFDLKLFRTFGTKILLDHLKKDLKSFNVEFDTWFSETSLYEEGAVEKVLTFLKDNNFTYVQDGATWLKTTLYRDEKDRVIVKSDGSYTYLLPDIAYHFNKLSRGYNHLIDVLGADHHGYIDRLHAAVSMVGGNSDLIDVDILQMVRVLENGEEVKMSKRSGKAITLIDLIDEVGTDALRYFYVDKSLSTHMDLDLAFMKSKSNENPVFYAQYAHARICGVFDKFALLGNTYKEVSEFKLLDSSIIKGISLKLAEYPSLIKEVSESRLVHKITHYINELSSLLHSFYNDEKIITDNLDETNEKLIVLNAVRIVLSDALTLVGVSSPTHME